MSYQPCEDSRAMIKKILLRILSTLRHPNRLRRPQSLFEKGFEWQSEFLFVPEKPRLGVVSKRPPASKKAPATPRVIPCFSRTGFPF